MSSASDLRASIYKAASSITAKIFLFASFSGILVASSPRIFTQAGSLEGPDVAHADASMSCVSCGITNCVSSGNSSDGGGSGSSGACACSCAGAGCGTGTGCDSSSTGDPGGDTGAAGDSGDSGAK